MTDDELEADLSAWLKRTVPSSPRPEDSARSVRSRMRPVQLPDAGWTPVATARHTLGTRASRIAPIGLVASVGILVIGVLAWGSVGPRRDLTVPPGASASPETDAEAVHWQTPVLDLRADYVELRIGDEVYTGAQVDRVDGSGYTRAFAVQPMWLDDGQTVWLDVLFRSDERSWWSSESELSLDGIRRADETEIGSIDYPDDGPPEVHLATYGTYVAFDPSDRIGGRLGEVYEGDWQLHGRTEVPTCGSDELSPLDVTLTFRGLRLEATPRAMTVTEQVAETLWGRFTILGPLVHGGLPRFEPRVLECPGSRGSPDIGGSMAP
jgi:hypothetical protein